MKLNESEIFVIEHCSGLFLAKDFKCDHGIPGDFDCAECKEHAAIMQWLERSQLAEEVFVR